MIKDTFVHFLKINGINEVKKKNKLQLNKIKKNLIGFIELNTKSYFC